MGLMDKFQKKKKDESDVSEPLRPNMNEVPAPQNSIEQMEAQILELKKAQAKAEVADPIQTEPVSYEPVEQVAEKEIAVPEDSEAFVQHLQNEFARVFRQMRPLEDHLVEIENLLAKYGQKPIVPKD